MDMPALRTKDDAELRDELLRLRRSEFEMRMQLRSGQLARNHTLRETRRDIARVKTLLTERRQGEKE
ncbi:MAG: 50S ribosomal protein L29 [Gammaproteobacteria bacterium]|nr:50S ribosomal protein L29 [Gammaproteobacteria bacterium]